MVETHILSQKEFKELICNGVTLIDFNAPWCDPCREQGPIIDALDDAYAGKAAFAKVNIDENQIIAMDLAIQSIPTIIIFKEGREMDRFIGLQAPEALDRALQAALGG